MGETIPDTQGGRLCSNHQGLHYAENIEDIGKFVKCVVTS